MSHYINLPLSGFGRTAVRYGADGTGYRPPLRRDVLRPASACIDGMSAGEFVAQDSPLWDIPGRPPDWVSASRPCRNSNPERERILLIAAEELARGEGSRRHGAGEPDAGLFSALAGNTAMVDYCDGKLGWGITEPDHGSDSLDADGSIAAATGSYGRPNCVARIEGDRIIVNGQKSAWVSGCHGGRCAPLLSPEENGKPTRGVAYRTADAPASAKANPEKPACAG